MAVEVIAKIKQINNGTFKLIDACDVEMSNGQDLETYLKNFNGSGGVCECDPEIYIGPTPPTDPNIKIWVDTSKQHVDSSFSSLVIQEFRDIISSLTKKVSVLEKEVAYLKAVVDGGDIPIDPIEPDTTSDILLVNEDGFLLVNELGQILCGNKQTETITSAQIMTNEDGQILTNENGQILCFNVGTVDNTQILVNENDQILTNENGDVLCFQVSDSTSNIQILVNENDETLINENGDILCLDVYNMLLVNEDDNVLVNENNQILKL